jgi:sugar phosphate isomerase/epimerase
MLYNRREAAKLGISALGLLAPIGFSQSAFSQSKPDSKWAGVQVGLNVPYNFGGRTMNAGEIIERCVHLGVNALELRSQPVEEFLGSPDKSVYSASVPQQATARKVTAEEISKWHAAVPMEKVRQCRQKFEDAGITIEIMKVDDIYVRTDEELDYFFRLAKALGARAISCEISDPLDGTKRVGRFADKHQMMVAYHGHQKVTPAIWEETFTYARFNGANVDLGHFVGGNKTSPVPFIKKHHDRITHVHVKDKTLGDKNVSFGMGDTPIKETLQLIRDNKWNIQATIEFEYPVPPGSDRMLEMAKCLEYCKSALLS